MNTENKDVSTKRTLLWVAITAALFLLSIGFVVVVGSAYWWMGRSTATVAAAKPSAATVNWSPGTFSAQAAEGVRQTSDNSWSIKGGRAFMQARRKDDGSLELRFVYPFDEFLPAETIALVKLRWSANQVENWAGALNITEEQIASLKAVSPATDIPVSGADRSELRTLFDDYLSATDKSAVENALVEAVAKIDQDYSEKTRQRIDGIAVQVKSIFNEEQLAALTEHLTPRTKTVPEANR